MVWFLFGKNRASLGWFAHPPEWYDLNNKYFAQSEGQSVSVFVQHLLNERVDTPQLDQKARGLENGSSVHDKVKVIIKEILKC